MAKSKSNRILVTPSPYARKHFLYVQEVGSLESIEPHISKRQNLDSYLFFLVTSGKGTLSYRGKVHLLAVGDCVWINCHEPYAHESSVEEPWQLMWLHFNGICANSFYQYFLEQGNSYLFKPFDITLFTHCLSTIYALQQTQDAQMELLSHKYITDMIAYCFRENKPIVPNEGAMSDKLLQIRTYIELHANQKLSLEQLSDQFFISKFHLSREYKKAYGHTIGNAILAKRVSMAKSLLRFSTKPIEQIAFDCGFQDSAYFIKVFKKAEGMTPLEYRKKW
ncbi:MAG: AraC family transcriptional regulator [Lachnospiraceae bacterium]